MVSNYRFCLLSGFCGIYNAFGDLNAVFQRFMRKCVACQTSLLLFFEKTIILGSDLIIFVYFLKKPILVIIGNTFILLFVFPFFIILDVFFFFDGDMKEQQTRR